MTVSFWDGLKYQHLIKIFPTSFDLFHQDSLQVLDKNHHGGGKYSKMFVSDNMKGLWHHGLIA